MPDDYLRHEIYTLDGLVALPSGSKILVPSEDSAFDMDHLIGLDRSLYFKNRYDNKIYKIDVQ